MTPSPDTAPHPQARWALASLALTMLMPSLDTSIANAGLPTLAQAFGASFPQVQWVVLAYLLAITTLIVGVGRLGDLLGRRRLLLAGIALFTGASLLCGAAPTLAVLVAARAAQGVGAALMMALTVALVGETVPRARTGSAMGLLGTVSAIGTTLGPSLGGVLIAGPGWRTLFLVNVPLGLVNLFLARRFLPADAPAPGGARPRLDLPGTALLALTLGAYALAMSAGRGIPGAATLGLLGLAAVGAVLFLAVERRAPAPLVRLELLRTRGLGAGLALGALVSTVVMATLVVGPFYLARTLALPAAAAGAALSVGPLVAALTGVPAGRLVDRLGPGPVAMLGLGGMTAGAGALALLPPGLGLPGYLAPLALVTSGYALFQAANTTALMAGVAADQRGLVSGLLSLSRNLGLITGASFMGAVFALASGSAEVTAASPGAVAAGLHGTFAVAALLLASGLAVAARGASGFSLTAPGATRTPPPAPGPRPAPPPSDASARPPAAPLAPGSPAAGR